VLGVESFPWTTAGFAALHDWLIGFGDLQRVGVEGTGAYGAGLARHLTARGVAVVEVDRPNRQARRMRGKSDQLDAVEAARAVISGRATGVAKTGDGNVEAMRALVEKGMDPRFVGARGTTALTLAAGADRPSHEVIRFLLDHGVDINATHHRSVTCRW
jgi:hypothetical protein